MNLPHKVMAQILEKTAEMQKKQAERLQRFGHVRAPISTEFGGRRVVAVGSRIFNSPRWKTFHDFLVNYLAAVLGKEWGDAELQKPFIDRHFAVQWYHQLCLHQQEVVKEPGKVHVASATAPVMAYMSLAYDLYALEHHALLQDSLLKRLKHRDQFQGARYETYVAASFVRAGFDIILQDETDTATSHCEFVATHKGSGAKYSVEAKSRHRPGYLGRPGNPQPHSEIKADVSKLLERALRKRADHERVVFLDVNVPPVERERLETDFLDNIAQVVDPFKRSNGKYPSAFVFLTNHPYHYVDVKGHDPGHTIVYTGIDKPSFSAKDKENPLRQYPAIADLFNSLLQHTEIPNDFEV